ncbi:MAG: PLP-dependent aminotransferase family protein [Dehalococcoidia bacterium]
MAQQPVDVRSLLTRAAGLGPSSWAAAPGRPMAISFGGGLPDPATFPIDDLVADVGTVLRRDGAAALQYGGLVGYDGLREYIADRTGRADGRAIDAGNVVLTTGSAHALSLACFAFVEPGDTVLIEAPTFAGSLRAIRSYGGRLVPVSVDEAGLSVDDLEEKLASLKAEGRRPKLLYTIPNFHNPAGVTLVEDRRRRLVQLAQEWHFLIAEDDAYGELRYDGDPLPSLFALDDSGLVLKLGSFSKVLAAGLRMGWAVGHPEVVGAMTSVRHDMGVSPLVARTIAEFATDKLGPHIQRLIEHYRRKRDAMVAALGEHCAPWVRFTTPEGGFFLWLELAPEVDPDALAQAAADEDVGYVPGTSFYADGGGRRNLRLAFSFVPSDDIERGIAGLGRALARSV